MKILLEDITDEGLSVAVEERFDDKELKVVSPVRGTLELNKRGQQIIISGSIGAELSLQCSRCLMDISRMVDIPFEVVYNPLKEISAERHELHDEDMDTGFYEGDEIDLHELLKEQILLNVQMKPLCSEDCKGICLQCGKDLNTGDCTCGKQQIDKRFEILKTLLKQ